MTKVSDWIYKNLGGDGVGDGGSYPPGDWVSIRFGEIDDDGKPMHVASFCEDGHSLFLGYSHKWKASYNSKDALRLGVFILWDWWIVSTWCGIRTKIWFWALHKRVEETKQWKPTE